MSIPYTVVLYNDSGEAVAALENATTPAYSRAKNTADQVKITVPRSDPKVDEVEIGMRFEILRQTSAGLEVEESGYVSEHGYDGDEYVINGLTEEILLSRVLTPAQFGYPLWSENATLDVFVENMLSRYVVERVKGNWSSYVFDANNIDYLTAPEFVLLLGSGTPTTYPASGHITLRFQKDASESWDRFRWVSDYDEEGGVYTTVQYRQGANVTEINAASFTTATAGALTDIVGLIPASESLEYLDVRVNFATDTEKASPVLYALEVIKRAPWEITNVDYPVDALSVVTPTVEADNSNFLDVLIDVCENVGWEFKVYNGELSIAETFGVDRTNEYTLVGS